MDEVAKEGEAVKKLPCLFVRDFADKKNPVITPVVTPGCEWVLNGEGVATRKWDGTACLIRDGQLYRRYDAKRGKEPPPAFEPAQDPDPVTGHWPGWLPVDPYNPDPSDVWIALAWFQSGEPGHEGTYEAVGPRINGNHENFESYALVPHGAFSYSNAPRTFEGLRDFLSTLKAEGIVFWRNLAEPDSDMVKIRRDDFGFEWPIKGENK